LAGILAYHKAGIFKELQKQKLGSITLVYSCIIWNTMPTKGIRPDLLALKHLETRMTRTCSVVYHWQYKPWSMRIEQCRGTHIINVFRMREVILIAKLCQYKPGNFTSIIIALIHLHVLKNAECGKIFRAISCAGSILQIFLQMDRRMG